jgi:dynein heavy chain
MTGTLYRDTKQAIKDFAEQPLDEFCAEHIAMVVLTVMQICWAQDVEECLNASKAIKALKAFYENKVSELEQMADMTRLNLTKLKRTALGAVITIFVHARDVIENMIAENVNKVSDFGWAKQLRYVWELKHKV